MILLVRYILWIRLQYVDFYRKLTKNTKSIVTSLQGVLPSESLDLLFSSEASNGYPYAVLSDANMIEQFSDKSIKELFGTLKEAHGNSLMILLILLLAVYTFVYKFIYFIYSRVIYAYTFCTRIGLDFPAKQSVEGSENEDNFRSDPASPTKGIEVGRIFPT